MVLIYHMTIGSEWKSANKKGFYKAPCFGKILQGKIRPHEVGD